MKNCDKWQPSKFILKSGRLIASRDINEVGIASRLNGNLIAEFYYKNLKIHAKGKLLDLGCGKVPLYHVYKEYITENVCVDWENTLHKNEYLDFECDLTKKLPFEDREFDTIILSDVLEHIPNPSNLWKEMARILAVDGKIIMNVPFYFWIHEAPHDYYRYTEFALKRFVEDSNLKLVKFESRGGAPEIVAMIFAKHLSWIPLIGIPLAIVAQYITEIFVQTQLGKKISEKTSQACPLGYYLIAQNK